jgi:hypothetical protein
MLRQRRAKDLRLPPEQLYMQKLSKLRDLRLFKTTLNEGFFLVAGPAPVSLPRSSTIGGIHNALANQSEDELLDTEIE